VFIVGGGNSAGQAAVFFSSYAESVTMLVRGDTLTKTMSQYLIDELATRRNIHIETSTTVLSVGGEDSLSWIRTSSNGQEARQSSADALFVMIGAHARTEWLSSDLERDELGYILTGRDLRTYPGERIPFLLETSSPGMFCAGDVRHASIKRVSSGIGEGSMAIAFIHQYLSLQEAPEHDLAHV
jgi:thioredoxin reductase (NADPH)